MVDVDVTLQHLRGAWSCYSLQLKICACSLICEIIFEDKFSSTRCPTKSMNCVAHMIGDSKQVRLL